MEYEYNKYICNNNTLKETLDKYGVAIIPNLINDNECKDINNGIWDYFEHITKNWSGDYSPIKKKNKKTWNNIFKLFPLHSQLFKHWGVGHSQVCWDTRQNIKIVNVFSHLWDCSPEELLVSFDGLSFCLPPEITNKGWQNKTWFHTDQSYLRNDLECIQSWVTANDIQEGDATLSIMESSHKYHKEFSETFNINNKSDWYKLNSIEEKFYKDKKCEYKKIKCPKGSLVLWDSRTIHCGTNPIKKRKKANIRSIIYLCYMKKNLCSENQTQKKQQLFYKKQTSNHWPCNPTPCPVNPHTYGENIPIITEIDKPNLNDLGKSLAGFDIE
jgi:hypothetical protein